MDANTKFEIKAKAFYLMTGYLPPGKDDRSGTPYEERVKAWLDWCEKHNSIVSSMLNAMEYIEN